MGEAGCTRPSRGGSYGECSGEPAVDTSTLRREERDVCNRCRSFEHASRRLLWHVFEREGFADEFAAERTVARAERGGSKPALAEAALFLARQTRQRFARLAAEWLRVGFVQSNYNSDNSQARPVAGVSLWTWVEQRS